MIHRFVIDWVDIPPGPLHEQRHTILAEILLDRLGSKPGNIRRISAVRRIGNRMTGKIVHHRQRSAIQTIQP